MAEIHQTVADEVSIDRHLRARVFRWILAIGLVELAGCVGFALSRCAG